MPKLSRAPRSSRRKRPTLLLEQFEPRELPATIDGSFATVALDRLRATPQFAGIDGSGIGIAVIDTGIFAQNPDLQSNVRAWFDAVTLNNNAPDNDPNFAANSLAFAFDPDGHGSHTAGTAASSNPAIGTAPGADIIAIRGLPGPNEARPNFDTVLEGLQWVFDHRLAFNIKVVNMSLGVLATNLNSIPNLDAEGQMIRALENAGVTVVVSSGNNYASFIDGINNAALPGAAIPSVFGTFTVANTWPRDYNFNGASFSLAGAGVPFAAFETQGRGDSFAATSQRSTLPHQVAAPGQQIFSTWTNRTPSSIPNDPNHEFLSGTSMSAPLVSGVVALMQQAALQFQGSYLSTTEVQQIILDTADTITDTNVAGNGRAPVVNGQLDFNTRLNLPETGVTYRRINALKALERVADLAPSGTGDADNTVATALNVGDLDGTSVFSQNGSIGTDGRAQPGPGDVDLFRINLTSTGVITADIGGASAPFFPYMRLFDAAGTEIDNNINRGTSEIFRNFQQRAILPRGTYFLGVSAFDNSAYNINDGSGAVAGNGSGAYQLSISLNNPDPNGVIPGALLREFPSELLGTIGSDPPPTGSTTRIQVGPADVDMFKVIAPDDGDLVVSVSVAGQANPLANLIRVFNAQGVQRASQAGVGLNDNVLRLTGVQTGEQLFVAVSDLANATYDPFNPYTRSAAGAGGEFEATLQFDNRDLNGTAPTASTGAIGTPIPISVGFDTPPGGQPALVGRDGSKDVDFFRFRAPESGFLSFNVTGDSGFVPSLTVAIYDEAANDILNIGNQTANPAQLILPVEANKDYWAAVTGQGNEGFKWFVTASGTGGRTGAAVLTATMLPASAGASLLNNAVNIAGQAATLTELSIGALVAESVGRDGNVAVGAADVDLFRFVAATTTTLHVRTFTGQEGSARTFLRAFDAAGAELRFSGDSDPFNTNNFLRLPVTAGQTFLIGVSGAGAGARGYNPLNGAGAASAFDSVGNYMLTVTTAATRLAITTPPPGAVTVDTPINLTVAAQDAAGNIDPTFNGNVTLSSEALGGSVTVNAVNGIATFAGVSLARAVVSSLQATSTGLSPAAAPIVVAPGTATQLAIATAPPQTVNAAAPFSIVVAALDARGNVATSFTGPVTLALAEDPVGGSLGGTLTVLAQQGLATFTGVTLRNPGTGWTLVASAGGLTQVLSAPITVLEPPAPPEQVPLAVSAVRQLTALKGKALFRNARLVLRANPQATLRVRIISTGGRLQLRAAGVRVAGNNTRALNLTGSTAALQRGLRLMSLTLARGQKRATVTVTVFDGLRSRSIRILVRG